MLVAAWGTETNVYANVGNAQNLDIYLTRSTNQTLSFEPVITLAGGSNIQGESQLRISPAGTDIYAVWTEQDSAGAINTMYAQLTKQAIPQPRVLLKLSGSGCSYNPILFFSLLALWVRRNAR